MKTEHNAIVIKAARLIAEHAEELKRSSTLTVNNVEEWDDPEDALLYRDMMRTVDKLRALTLVKPGEL